MAIYVDSLLRCVRSAKWRWNKSCHMFADTLTELHEMDRKLKLRRSWFQENPTVNHYDLTENKREAAIRLGAKEVGAKEAVAIWKRLRQP